MAEIVQIDPKDIEPVNTGNGAAAPTGQIVELGAHEVEPIASAPVNLTPKPPKPEQFSVSEEGLGPVGSTTAKIIRSENPDVAAAERQQFVENYNPTNVNSPLSSDPLARIITAGLPATGAGLLAAGLVPESMPWLARVIGGVTEGATATKLQGGTLKDVAIGGAIGGAIPLAQGTLESAAVRSMQNTQRQVYKEYARAGNQLSKEKLTSVGPEAVAGVIQKYKLGSITNPQVAKEATINGINQATQARAAALETIGKAHGEIALSDVETALNKLEHKFASVPKTRQFAEDVAQLRHEIINRYGKGGGKVVAGSISPKALTDEISAYLDPKLKQAVQRQTGSALKEVLDNYLDAAGSKNPIAKEAAERIRTANKDLEVLSTLKPIVNKLAVASKLQQTFAERLQANPVQAAKDAGNAALKVPIKAAMLPKHAADFALAQFLMAKRSGATVTPAMVQHLIASGVAPEIAQKVAQ